MLTYHCAGRPILGALPAANLAARIIEREGSGIWVRPGDADGMAAAADKLVFDDALRQACGEAARRYAEATFDIEAIGERFDDVLQPVCG